MIMDDVIREIAMQLGVGVDQIWSMVPSYADMMFLDCFMLLIIEAIIFVPMFVISYRKFKKDEYSELPFMALTVSSLGLTALVITACIVIPDMIQWKLHPYEMFLRSIVVSL